jgi:hypothetical protein
MEAATRLARLRSDLAAAAGPSLGSAKELGLTPVWRCLVGSHHHVPVLPVRPHDARARFAHTSCIVRFDSDHIRPRPFALLGWLWRPLPLDNRRKIAVLGIIL